MMPVQVKKGGAAHSRADGKPRNYHVKRLKALQVIKARTLENKSNVQIAKELGVNENTVRRLLTWAEKAQIFVEVEDKILNELVPAAVDAVLHDLIVEKNAQTGLKVLQGINLLKTAHPVTAKDVKDSDDLARYVAGLRDRAQLEANTVAGELLEPREPLRLGRGQPPDGPSVDSTDPAEPLRRDNEVVSASEAAPGADSDENRLPDPAPDPGDEPVSS